MSRNQILGWSVVGILLSYLQSFFLVHTLLILWTIFLSWKHKNCLWLLFAIGIVNDLFMLNFLGTSVFIYLGIYFFIFLIKRTLSLNEKFQIKLKKF